MIDLEARETLPRPRRDRTGARALAFDDVDADAATPRASDDVARAPALPRPAPASSSLWRENAARVARAGDAPRARSPTSRDALAADRDVLRDDARGGGGGGGRAPRRDDRRAREGAELLQLLASGGGEKKRARSRSRSRSRSPPAPPIRTRGDAREEAVTYRCVKPTGAGERKRARSPTPTPPRCPSPVAFEEEAEVENAAKEPRKRPPAPPPPPPASSMPPKDPAKMSKRERSKMSKRARFELRERLAAEARAAAETAAHAPEEPPPPPPPPTTTTTTTPTPTTTTDAPPPARKKRRPPTKIEFDPEEDLEMGNTGLVGLKFLRDGGASLLKHLAPPGDDAAAVAAAVAAALARDDVGDAKSMTPAEWRALARGPRGEHVDVDTTALGRRREKTRGDRQTNGGGHGEGGGGFDADGRARERASRPSSKFKGSRRGPRSDFSNFRGVTCYKRTGRWEAHIWDAGRQRHLGSFATAEGAARAYDKSAIKVRPCLRWSPCDPVGVVNAVP